MRKMPRASERSAENGVKDFPSAVCREQVETYVHVYVNECCLAKHPAPARRSFAPSDRSACQQYLTFATRCVRFRGYGFAATFHVPRGFTPTTTTTTQTTGQSPSCALICLVHGLYRLPRKPLALRVGIGPCSLPYDPACSSRSASLAEQTCRPLHARQGP